MRNTAFEGDTILNQTHSLALSILLTSLIMLGIWTRKFAITITIQNDKWHNRSMYRRHIGQVQKPELGILAERNNSRWNPKDEYKFNQPKRGKCSKSKSKYFHFTSPSVAFHSSLPGILFFIVLCYYTLLVSISLVVFFSFCPLNTWHLSFFFFCIVISLNDSSDLFSWLQLYTLIIQNVYPQPTFLFQSLNLCVQLPIIAHHLLTIYLMSTSTQISTIKFMILSTDLFIFWSSVSVNGTTTYSAVSHALLRVSLTTSLVTFMYPLFPQKYHILVYIHHVVSELLRIPQVSI